MYYSCQAGSGLVGEDDVSGSGGAVAARIDSSYMINLRDLDMRHVKDFTFVHGEHHTVLFVTILPLVRFLMAMIKREIF
jgi:cleavage and polyadenylation specificity factor subunit 1